MSYTPWPVEGLTFIKAFERSFGPEVWKAARERAGIESFYSTHGGCSRLVDPFSPFAHRPADRDAVQHNRPRAKGGAGWQDQGDRAWRIVERPPRGCGGTLDLTAALKIHDKAVAQLEINARATALLQEQFTAMLVAGDRATSGRIGDPFAPRIQLEPSQWRYLDPNSRSGEAIAVGPNGRLVYDVRVYEDPWTSTAAEPRTAPAAAVAQATNCAKGIAAAGKNLRLKTGKQPVELERVKAAMLRDVKSGALVIKGNEIGTRTATGVFIKSLGKELEAKYKSKTDTTGKARMEVVALLGKQASVRLIRNNGK
jgi:hypothetical protein